MAYRDLREFITHMDSLGQVKRLEGVHWDLELGTITEVAAALPSCPMLLFDRIVDSPPGFRVLTNILHTEQRLSLALSGSPDFRGVELVKLWKEALTKLGHGSAPLPVGEGPVQEHVVPEEDLNILTFPVPKWHALDGGRYIAGAITIMKDPEEGWINLGIFRLQVHGPTTLGIMITPGKHGKIIMERYWARGESCPVAVSLGQAPSLLLAASVHVPWGTSEYEFAGAIGGRAIEVLPGRYTRLPVPAHAEIVLEGEIPPLEEEHRGEGPFGEATGYYTFEVTSQPVIRIKGIMYRDDPIIAGLPPLGPFPGLAQYAAEPRVATVWNDLERSGLPGIEGVWRHGYGFTVIALKQAYAGHAKQAALIATGSRGTLAGRAVVVVDEDIDPANLAEVIWAISTRCDPERNVEIVKEGWSSDLDPVISSEEKRRGNFTSGRIIINACVPFLRKREFPPRNTASAELKAEVWEKWKDRIA